MKALALAVMGCCGVASMFPVAALADTFTGVCVLSGTATLAPGLGATPKAASFSFNTDGSANNRCTGKLNGATVSQVAASAIANGTGNLACSASTGKGSGTLTIAGVPIGFNLQIVGSGPQVSLVLKGAAKGTAVGQASFATDSTAAGQCAAQNATSLTFLIAATASSLAD